MLGSHIRIKEKTFERYQQAFYFFQSKPVNAILSRRKTPMPILFRDLQFMSDEIEYLKRYYMSNQSLVRILKLIIFDYVKKTQDYYDSNMETPKPNYIPFESYAIIHARYRKLHRLKQEKSKSNEDGQEQAHDQDKTIEGKHSSSNLLEDLDNSCLSELEHNQERSSVESFDSEVHDIFEINGDSKISIIYSSLLMGNFFDLASMKQSKLIIDFKRVQPSKEVVRKQMKIKNQNEESNDKSQPSQKLLKIPNFQAASGSILRGEKKNSFMEYYNSLPKKQSTNILQKYIKEKK